VALRTFGGFAYPYTSGWVRVGRVTLHLVQVVRSSSRGALGLFPDQLVWLVVIRDVTIPNLGPPGRSRPLTYIGTMAVFVRTDVPRYIVATSFEPSDSRFRTPWLEPISFEDECGQAGVRLRLVLLTR
jgi:hypothetical protein